MNSFSKTKIDTNKYQTNGLITKNSNKSDKINVLIKYIFCVFSSYSTVTDLVKTTTFTKYIPFLSFKYILKTNRFVYHKKELIESREYTDFDIVFRSKV